ncbi:MAG: hypothetical protein ACI32G_05505, partial [Bulleidia sp.]
SIVQRSCTEGLQKDNRSHIAGKLQKNKGRRQERNNYLRGMVEAKIPVEIISSILHMSVDAVRKQASLLGCVL